MNWITAAEVREGDTIWLPYAQRELAVWSITAGDVILFGGSMADPRKPGCRTEVSGARYRPAAQVGLISPAGGHS